MSEKPYLSVVIPAYNEEGNIKRDVLDSVFSYLNVQDYSWEIILVDDGSTDNTLSLLKKLSKNKEHVSVVENPHQGKAGAVISGVLKASGKYILFTDFDQATPILELEKILPHLESYDIVIGSRAGRRKGAPFSRIVMARGFMMLRKLILGINVEDTQCGFKIFRHDVAHNLFKKLKLYENAGTNTGSRVTAGFDVELLFLAKKLGVSIKEVPVKWRYVETRRVSPIMDSIEGLTGLIKIRMFDLQGSYVKK